eukprot:m.221527 g.221527  ORF g.221527 m.221527 type:complete len:205 (+) comp15827_c0_seq1:2090-2704(+)
MSITEYNGAAIIAMTGKNCVAIAADRRFGIQGQMVSCDFQKIFRMGERVFVALPGLATDVQTVAQRLQYRHNMYKLREEREMTPKTMLAVISNLLYEKRFGPYFVEPMVAGLNPDGTPYVGQTDLIGCQMTTEDFVVGGTCSEQLFGMCESLWRPNLSPAELFETISQALMSAMDRDALSGYGVIVHVIEQDKVTTRTVKTRMD